MTPKFAPVLGWILWMGLAPGLPAAEPAPKDLTLFVATNGQDRWSGRVAVPTADGTDGPLASVLGARDAVRRARAAAPDGLGAVAVQVRGGTYWMNRPLVLEPRDSGTAETPIVFRNYPGERPVLSGGRLLSGFLQNGPLWECDLPDVQAGQWYFRQLFVNGTRCLRARAPNEGYFRIAKLFPGPKQPNAKPVARDRFGFRAGDLQPYARLGDVDLVLMHSWETSIHPLKAIDPVANVVELAAPMKEWWTIGYWEEAQRFYVENALELLDQPGEWYLNRETGRLSYYPRPGERLGQVQVVAPVLTELARLQGDPDTGAWVRHITLQGLAFQHADWVLAPQGNSSTQAAVDAPAAITADGADHCALEGCEIAHVGAYGLWFRRGCKDCRMQRNRVHDLGAGGLRVGEANPARNDAAESTRNLVDNNHIFDTGHVLAAGIGFWLAQSSHNRISHNDIHDTRYSGMSIGWNWGDEPNRTHHNLIEFNHVHHVSNGYLSDSGLIYCLGASPGSVIRNNVFHDNWPYTNPPFGWGIYLDATCSGYLVESNLVYNTLSGGLMFNNGGHEHVIRNNVFALSANLALWPYWEKRPNTFQHNLVYLTQGELLVNHAENSLNARRNAKDSLGLWDQNLYWHTGGADRLRFFKHRFAEWQALGLDRGSRLADPLFVNAAAYDFRLREGSPALALGFQRIDTSQVGLYGDPAWVQEPRLTVHAKTILPPPPTPPGPKEVADDFESTSLGSHPNGAQVSGEEQGASICITDEQAAGGRHSLKVTDAKDLRPSWQPHFYYEPRLTTGRVRQSFDLFLGTNAQFFTEWRDRSAYPQNVGPSVRFDERGQVSAGNRTLTKIPTGQWVHVELEGALGANAPRQFTLSLTLPGGRVEVFPDLAVSGQDFQELQWLGFSCTSVADAVFYLDNLKVQRIGGRPESPARAAAADLAPGAGLDPKQVNVIVINIDPILKTRQNLRLHQYLKWSDPWRLTEKMVEDARVASAGYVNYRVVEKIDFDGFTTFRNGFTYTEEAFLNMWEKDRKKADKGMTSFKWLFQQFDLAAKLKALDATEIWLWGAPYMQWDELHWKTPGDKIPYQTDNPWFYRPYDIPDLGKTIWIMGWNYERGEGEMLESYCHRIESVLSLTVGQGLWDHKRAPQNVWNRFTRVEKNFPGESEVGSVHYAPNSKSDYDWNNTNLVWTYADDWLTYPDLPRQKKQLNAVSGGWDGIVHHHLWWMQHLPHRPGVTDGFHNNWWQYIVNYDEAVRQLPPPGATLQKARTAMYAE